MGPGSCFLSSSSLSFLNSWCLFLHVSIHPSSAALTVLSFVRCSVVLPIRSRSPFPQMSMFLAASDLRKSSLHTSTVLNFLCHAWKGGNRKFDPDFEIPPTISLPLCAVQKTFNFNTEIVYSEVTGCVESVSNRTIWQPLTPARRTLSSEQMLNTALLWIKLYWIRWVLGDSHSKDAVRATSTMFLYLAVTVTTESVHNTQMIKPWGVDYNLNYYNVKLRFLLIQSKSLSKLSISYFSWWHEQLKAVLFISLSAVMFYLLNSCTKSYM